MEKQPQPKPSTQPLLPIKQQQKEILSPTNPQRKHNPQKAIDDKQKSATFLHDHKEPTHNTTTKEHHDVHGHHHYHHVEPALVIRPQDLVDPYPYLMEIYKMKEKVDSYYMKNTQQYVNYWKREVEVNFTTQGWQLINYDVVINMQEFLKQDWRNLEYIGFSGCKIDDIKWRLFADHAHLFPNLKWLSIQIKHTLNVREGDLEKFGSLQKIEFNYEQWTHPLTIPSKNYLKAFAKAHPKVQVSFG